MSRGIVQTKIGEIMQKEVISITEDTTIKDLKELFERYGYNAFPVVRKMDLVGIVTKLDFLNAFTVGRTYSRRGVETFWASKAGEIMRTAVVHLGPDASIQEAVDYMLEFKLRSLPVVERGKLVGIVAIKDVLPYLMTDSK